MLDNIAKNFLLNGYIKTKLFNISDILMFKKKIIKRIASLSKNQSIIKNHNDLKFCHKKKKQDGEATRNSYLKSDTRFIGIEKNFLKKKIKILRPLMKSLWGHCNYKIVWVGSVNKNQIKINKAGFRIVRPNLNVDSGSPHIDAYSKNINEFFTIWFPLVGHGSKYSMVIAKGSHKHHHPSQAFERQKKILSRAFKQKYLKNFFFIRPNLKIGEVIVHHPNLIHGGKPNIGRMTRTSIEIRLFNAKTFSKKKII